MVIFFIATMFISMGFGIICIKLFRYLNREYFAYALLDELATGMKGTASSPTPVVVGSADGVGEGKTWDHVEQQLNGAANGDNTKQTVTHVSQQHDRPSLKYLWLKYLHGFLMFYSFVMILGAAGAFGSNARVDGFPYNRGDETDMLYGRCYGRNLNDSSIPTWLTSLSCGKNAWCNVQSAPSATTQSNPYKANAQ